MWYRNFLLFIFIIAASSSTAQQKITNPVKGQQVAINNTASISKRSGYYNWTVFVEADSLSLNNIDHVEYLLHPTFSNPEVNSYSRNTNFSYSSNGWGEFEIKAKIVFKNKKAQYISYWLRLQSKVSKILIRR